MSTKKLFNEFSPVTTEEWIKKIEKDLKGKPYHKLIKKTAEGFDIKPFYREENLEKIKHTEILPGNFPYLRGKKRDGNHWLLRQDIIVENIDDAYTKANYLNQKGVNSLGFIFKEGSKPDKYNLENLLKNINSEIKELNFSGDDILTLIDSIISQKHKDFSAGSFNYDPLGFYTLHGYWKKGKKNDFNTILKIFEKGKYLPDFQLITINAHIFHNTGGSIVSELAHTLAMGTEYLTYLTENDISIDEAASKIRFHFAIGSEYFMEIAKFRAFRYLWATAVKAYGLKNDKNATTHIHASNSVWNKTVYDPYVNMLRTTTENMSAIISGVDSITVLPFNSIYEKPDEFSERIARNQPLILKEESHFDKVVDPAAGSYYIENLTKELIQLSWEYFLEIDEKGGYSNCFKKGIIQKKIKSEALAKDMKIATRRYSILGINQYPNTSESIDKLKDESILFSETVKNKQQETEPLTAYRGAMPFEQLRYKTDRYSEEHSRPTVWMFTYGNLAMRRARSQFAENFFGVAGFKIIDNTGFDTVEEGLKKAKKDKPDIVVICSSDEDYKTIALPAYEAFKNDFIVVLAGLPEKGITEQLKAAGMKNFIHVKSNLLEELKKYQKMVNIE